MLILSHHPQVISITKSSITSVVGLVSAEMAVAESNLGAHYPMDVLKIPGGWHHYIKFTYDPPSLILRVADASGVQVRNLCLDRLTDLFQIYLRDVLAIKSHKLLEKFPTLSRNLVESSSSNCCSR